jgi:hypothetical protein
MIHTTNTMHSEAYHTLTLEICNPVHYNTPRYPFTHRRGNNDLTDIPAGLGYLSELQHVMLPGNPLRKMKRSLVTAGAEALKKYGDTE